MDLPEEIQKLVSELGDSLLDSLAENPACRELALRIQESGYDLCLVLEATHAPKEDPAAVPLEGWSEEDMRTLQDFRIALD
ncbi:MAG TPA: hypothetical protein VFT46_13060 [Holophagaceae bacterium]|nr:hypothetical protein [Holophagaceae bacterium]HEU4952872.1 hypothetical protein [Holophagaceae bacterium]